MAVELGSAPEKGRHGESGQSIIEFLLMVPIVIGLTMMMIKVNTVIQISIVNQKYARAQALFIAYNSPYFPELRFRKEMIEDRKSNQMILGVSGKIAPEEGVEYFPDPVIYRIVGKGKDVGIDDGASEDVNRRGRIRVRTSVAMCTQVNVVESSGEIVAYSGSGSVSLEPLSGDVKFPFCRGVFSE